MVQPRLHNSFRVPPQIRDDSLLAEDTSAAQVASNENEGVGQGRMSAKELEELEKQTQTVEQQMTFLTNCVNRLSKELAMEQTTNKLLKSHVDDAWQKLEERKTRDVEADRRQMSSDVRSLQFRGLPVWMEPQHPQVQAALAENDELRRFLEETRLSTAELRNQYEKQLTLLRNAMTQKKGEERGKIIRECDFVINKYHHLARSAAKLAREEREKTKQEKARVQKLAEAACKAFERDIRDKMKKALDEYRTLAQEAHEAAKKERADLIRHCSNIETTIDKERKTFEAQIVREAEKRVSSYREACDKINQQMLRDKTEHQKNIDELCDVVEKKCKQFERDLLGKTLQILWEHGIDMEEAELLHLLSSASGVPLRSEVLERSRKEAEIEKLIQDSKSVNEGRYGFIQLKIREIPDISKVPDLSQESEH